MKYIVNSKQMYQLEENAMQEYHLPSLVLMERAALAVVSEIYGMGLENRPIVCLCGTGNNGADGLAVARILAERQKNVSVLLVGDSKSGSKEYKEQLKMLKSYEIPFLEDLPENCPDMVYIDGVFGIGCNRMLDDKVTKLMEQVNDCQGYKLAIDISSGIDSNGRIMGAAFRADTTVTFSYAKTGQLLYPGKEYSGHVVVCQIGITDRMFGEKPEGYLAIEKSDLEKYLPKRPMHGHKGTFGKLFVIAGSMDMAGAAYLCATAAYRVGAGLVKILTPECNRVILQTRLPEAILSTYEDKWNEKQVLEGLQWADAVLIGPGLGTGTQQKKLFDFVFANAAVPVVCDADGLNILAEHTNRLLQPHTDWVLTPHVGEMSRLRQETIAYIQEHLIETAEEFARDYQVIVALKDATSVAAIPYEDTYLNLSGCNGMATAGSGDVLAGMIAGLIVTGMKPGDAACYGMYLHGLAGEDAATRKSTYSMIASDLLESVAHIFNEI